VTAALSRNQLIASAAGTLEVLEVLSAADGALPLGAIVDATGRPKGTVHRMLATLVNTGFVTHDATSGRYRPTLKLWRLGASAVRDLDITTVARPALEDLMSQTGETVHLGLLDPSGAVVYVAKVESPQSIRVQTRLGQLNPSWCTATGRSLLAFHPEIADKVLSGRLESRTPKTVTDPRRIRASLNEVREKGYAVTRAENHPEMGGIAAPIRDHTGNVSAACGIAIPAYRMERSLVERSIPSVLRASGEISRLLGHITPKAARPNGR
jgi:IclR family KDG regulon transcriptional repressor